MKTDNLQPVALTNVDSQRIASLLLNAWTAEYSFRLRPVSTDGSTLQDWAKNFLIQSCESVGYSLQTILLSEGTPVASKLSLVAAAKTLHQWGFYEDTNLKPYFFGELVAHQEMARRIGGESCNEASFGVLPSLTLDALSATHDHLLALVDAAVEQHERYLLRLLGLDVFVALVTDVPQYIRAAFLDKRLLRLFLQHTEVEGLPQ